MSQLSTTGIKTISSVELVKIINEVRKEEGQVLLRHDHFMTKLENHPGIDSPILKGEYKDSTGRKLKCYNLPKREAELMAMSESLVIQAKVYDRMTALELEVSNPAHITKAPRLTGPEREAMSIFTPALRIAKLCGLTGNQALLAADKASIQVTGVSTLALIGQTHLIAANQSAMHYTPTELGKTAGMSAVKFNLYLENIGYQTRVGNAWHVSHAGLPYAVILDTGKKHGSGTPIQQIKWLETVMPSVFPAKAA